MTKSRVHHSMTVSSGMRQRVLLYAPTLGDAGLHVNYHPQLGDGYAAAFRLFAADPTDVIANPPQP